MPRFRRVTLSALVWLTAAAVCLAELPRFHCRCTNAPSQPVVLVAADSGSNCCCGGGCCTATESSSCCGNPDSPPVEPTDSNSECCHDGNVPRDQEPGLASAPAGCTGTLVQAETFTPTSGRTTVADSLTACCLGVASSDVVPEKITPSVRLTRQTDHLPPPTDPVIAFRHLLI